MSFYLLKSTLKRERVGDFLINKDNIESVAIVSKELDDLANPIYLVCVTMNSKDTWKGVFNTLAEAKNVVKELLENKIDDAALNDYIPQAKD